MNFEQELTLVIVDSGILGLLIAAAIAIFSRSQEKLKSSLAWDQEILKVRPSAAKAIMESFSIIQERHDECMHILAFNQSPDLAKYNEQDQIGIIDSQIKQARLLFDESALDLIEKASHSVFWFLEESQKKDFKPMDQKKLVKEQIDNAIAALSLCISRK